MDRGAFSSEEVENITETLGSNYSIKNYSDKQINTEIEFDSLYEKSRGCMMVDNWCLFLITDGGSQRAGNIYKFSQEGIIMITKKYSIDLK